MTRGSVWCRRTLALVCCTLVAGWFWRPDALRAKDGANPEGRVVALNREDCARLLGMVPADAADYVPGVDVEGRPVAAADLPRGSFNPALRAAEIDVDLGGSGRRWRPFARPADVIVGQSALIATALFCSMASRWQPQTASAWRQRAARRA